MFHKSQTAIKNYSKTLNYKQIALKISSRKSRLTTKSPGNTKKRFTPRVHSSFTICDEIYSPHCRLRSTSVDRKHKTVSFDHSGLRKSQNQMQSYQKFDEKVLKFINQGRQDIQKGKYLEAAAYFTQALEVDAKCLDALYNKGLANMLMSLYKEATIDFLNVLRENVLYNKDVYLKLAMCFQSMGDVNTAVRYITQGLNRFPRFHEGFLLRGQFYNELKQWEKAMGDFKKVLSSSKSEGNALLGIAESLEGIGDFSTAIQMLEQAASYPETMMVSVLKKAILKVKINDLSCLDDFDVYLEHNPTCAKGFFHKAEVLFFNRQHAESALCYEQCIKYDNNFEYIPRAIFRLGAIKINEKDFYGALHTFERAGRHEIKDQKTLQIFAEAVINLMKRKYKEGISTFNKLLKRQDPIMKEYILSCYMYRGYGYNAMNLHEKAIRSFKKASVYGKINKASMYNLELSHALNAISKSSQQGCLSHLEKCLRIFPKKAEPHIYHAAILLSQGLSSKSNDKLQEAEDLLSFSMKLREIDSEMLFFRATIRYLMQKLDQALDDIKQAIEKAEDNIPEHYILRGLIFASERLYNEAVQDFSISLQLKETLDYVYWFRSRAAYLFDDTNLAFSDLQKFMLSGQTDPEVFYKAAVLLIMGGSYDDALKALANSFSLKQQSKTVYLKAKCFVIMNDVQNAILELGYFSEQKLIDTEILKYLNVAEYRKWKKSEFEAAVAECTKWTKGLAGEIFELKHILWMRGVFYMYSDDFQSALSDFQRVLELLHKDSNMISADEALTTEEENCEVLYNIALCHTACKKSQALAILTDLAEILNSKHRGQMLLLSAIIHLSNSAIPTAEKLLKEAFHCDPETVTPFLSKETTTILPLNTANPFAQQLPLLNLQVSSNPVIKVRPAVSLPRSTLPNIEFVVEKEAEGFFTIGKITPRPEAPWLNRIRGSIQFTSTLVDIEEASQVTERENKENEVEDKSQEEIKRLIKSDIPLRHFSSYIKVPTENHEEKKDNAPVDILDKIRNFCKRGSE